MEKMIVGSAFKTGPGDLHGKFKYILHAILPNWSGQNDGAGPDF